MLFVIFCVFGYMLFSKKITTKFAINTTCILMILLICFSFGFGTDYFSYMFIFDDLNFGHVIGPNSIDALYLLMEIIFRRIGIDYHIFSIIIRTIIFYYFLKWIIHNSQDFKLSILLFFSMFFTVWVMSAYRQGLVLAIGLFFIVNQKKEIDPKKAIFYSITLSLIHSSALVFIPIYFLRYFSVSKRVHVLLLITSIMTTFIPVDLYIYILKIIPFGTEIIKYIEGSTTSIFDISSLMRLAFFILIFLHYSLFEENKYYKYLRDLFLIGNSIYFILKFSEITAGRMTIFSYILAVILLPIIINHYLKFIRLKGIILFSVLVFSLVFLTKDLVAFKSQVGYKGNKSIFSLDSIWNYDFHDYDNIYAYNYLQRTRSSSLHNEFKLKVENFSTNEFDKDNTYMGVRDSNTNKYGIVSSDSSWLFSPTFDTLPIVSNDTFSYTTKNELLPVSIYGDMYKKEENQIYLRKKDEINKKNSIKNNIIEEVNVNITFADLFLEDNIFKLYVENIKSSRTISVNQNEIVFHIMFVQYYDYNLFIYLNHALEPISDMIFTNISYFNSDGLLRLQSYGKIYYYDKEFNLVWIE